MNALIRRTREYLVRTAVVLAFVVPAVSVRAETLADALTSAYNHSGLLDQNRALLRAADEDVAIAAAALQPIINWSARLERGLSDSTVNGTVGLNRSRRYSTDVTLGLTASLLLYDSGSSKASINAAKETVLATRAALISLEQRVLLRGVSAYLNVLQTAEIVALRQNNLRLLTQELRAARDRFEVGEVTRTDVALAEARLAQARSGLASAQGDEVKAIGEYRNVIGRKPVRLRTPSSVPRTETSLARAKDIAVRRHPDMIQVQHQVAAAEFNIKAAQADMNPTVSLNGGLSVSESLGSPLERSGGTLGIEVTGPVYQGGRLSSLVRRNMATRDAQRGNLHIVRHDVQQSVGDAFADVAIASARLQASDRQIRAARIAFQGVREEATLGARTTLDVLDAEQELLDAEASRISAQTQQYFAAYSVLASMGLLTAENLKLPVQLYDPEAYYNLVKDGVAVRSRQGRQLDKVLRALQKD